MDFFGDLPKDAVGGGVLELGFDVEDDAVAQGGKDHAAQVFIGDVVAARQDRVDLPREDEGLDSAGAGPVADEAGGSGGAPTVARVGRHNKTGGVVEYRLGDGHLSDCVLQAHEGRGVHDHAGVDLAIACGAPPDLL